jgi:hypothetical protein
MALSPPPDCSVWARGRGRCEGNSAGVPWCGGCRGRLRIGLHAGSAGCCRTLGLHSRRACATHVMPVGLSRQLSNLHCCTARLCRHTQQPKQPLGPRMHAWTVHGRVGCATTPTWQTVHRQHVCCLTTRPTSLRPQLKRRLSMHAKLQTATPEITTEDGQRRASSPQRFYKSCRHMRNVICVRARRA